MSAVLYGVGVGPGDPQLLTLEAVQLLQTVPVVAYPAPETGDGLARAVASTYLPKECVELIMRLPLKADAAPPDGLYDAYAAQIAEHLESGRDVAVLCLGDPLFYGTFMYLHRRLSGRFESRVLPGVSSLSACTAAARLPLTSYDESLAVVPATLSEEKLRARLDGFSAAAVMKVGRHVEKVQRVLARLGLLEHAVLVERASMDAQKVIAFSKASTASYFSMVLVRSDGGAGR